MKKGNFLIAFILILIFLSACGSQSNSLHYGDELTKDSLRVCVDSWRADPSLSIDNEYETRKFFQALAEEIKTACGIEKVTFEILPQEGAERETTLQRLRTEIMAGGGPDVFIMQPPTSLADDVQHRYSLFNFPEKNMEAGLFLPLDSYMETATQFTDWNAQTKAVMDAGRNEEGQLIIPLTYTFPVLIYPESGVRFTVSSASTMQDILNNSETEAIGAVLYSSLSKTDRYGTRSVHQKHLGSVLGKLADYKAEELCFTEQELTETVAAMAGLHDAAEKNPLQSVNTYASYVFLISDLSSMSFDEEMSLVPVYSKDGGVTASITAYAAVNRNTNFPEEAFSVIDYIMQEKTQRESKIYSTYFNDGLPLQNDLGSESKTLCATVQPQRFLTEPYFEDLLMIKEQITAVNFISELDIILDDLMYNSVFDDSFSDADISEAYEKMKRMMGE